VRSEKVGQLRRPVYRDAPFIHPDRLTGGGNRCQRRARESPALCDDAAGFVDRFPRIWQFVCRLSNDLSLLAASGFEHLELPVPI
jgi:hypothetical protein